VTNHLGLDLDLVELLARVDTNDAANHLGDDNHVTEVSLDGVGLLVGLGLLLRLAELLDETHGAALQAAVDSATGTGVDDIAELVGGEVEEAKEGKLLVFSCSAVSYKFGDGMCRRSGMLIKGEVGFARLEKKFRRVEGPAKERRVFDEEEERTCQGRHHGRKTCGKLFSS
jgi:hypothetical protein